MRDPRVLDIHIPMTTLLELDNRSGWIEGLGPVPAELTRMLLPVAGLRRVYVDPGTGVPIGLDSTLTPVPAVAVTSDARDRLLGLLGPAVVTHQAQSQHDPSGALARFVAVRDRHCTGIGCSQQAAHCDIDHEVRWPDGPTAAWSLSSKSKRCHRAKHAGWQVSRDEFGCSTWTSPLGHSYARPGVWQAPTPVPYELTLPDPQPTPKPPDYPPPRDLPLWPEHL